MDQGTQSPDSLNRRVETWTSQPLLAELPNWATVLETAPHLSYEEAVHVAGSILNDIKRGTLIRPYPENVRHSLRVCAAVFARESSC